MNLTNPQPPRTLAHLNRHIYFVYQHYIFPLKFIILPEMRQGVMLAHIWAEKNGEGINGQVLDFEGGAEDSENSNSKTQQKQKIPSIS